MDNFQIATNINENQYLNLFIKEKFFLINL